MESLDDELRAGLSQLLDAIESQGIDRMPSQESREQILRNMTFASPDAAAGVQALTGMTLFLAYGVPDPETGLNPNWEVFGYSGPPSRPPEVAKPIAPVVPEHGATLEADVCVVGSGSGGAVIAGMLAQHGQKVSLVGWSLGGVYARQLASELPQMVRSCIMLGSPIHGDPRSTNAWRLYELASGQSVDDPELQRTPTDPPKVPTTSRPLT